MKLLSLKIPAELDERLRAEARRKRVPVSTIARESIAEYLAKGKIEAKPGSVLEAIQDLVGCVEGGPVDLASNPVHMEGFGEDRRQLARRRKKR